MTRRQWTTISGIIALLSALCLPSCRQTSGANARASRRMVIPPAPVAPVRAEETKEETKAVSELSRLLEPRPSPRGGIPPQENAERVKKLLEQGADPNAWDEAKCTPLSRASAYGFYKTVMLLLKHGANVDLHPYFPPLVAAANNHHARIVRVLLAHGAVADSRAVDGRTPLMDAARSGDFETTKALIDGGADVNADNGSGNRPLDFAGDDELIFELLKRHGAKSKMDPPPLIAIGRSGKIRSINQRLLAAVERHDEKAVISLPARGADANARLYPAGQNGSARSAQVGSDRPTILLLAMGYRPGGSEESGGLIVGGPLNLPIIWALLKRGADPNAKTDAEYGSQTALMLAVELNQYDLVQRLLDYGARINERDKNGRTALMKAVGEIGETEIVQLLLARGAKANLQDAEGETALMEAALSNAIESMQLLLAAGARADLRDKSGNTAYSMMDKFSMGAPWPEVRSKLKAAAPRLRMPMTRKAATRALFDAIADNDTEDALFALKAGADPNATEDYQDNPERDPVNRVTPLLRLLQSHHRMGSNSEESPPDNARLVRALLDKGADPNAKDSFGETALQYATQERLAGIVDLLKKAGAKE